VYIIREAGVESVQTYAFDAHSVCRLSPQWEANSMSTNKRLCQCFVCRVRRAAAAHDAQMRDAVELNKLARKWNARITGAAPAQNLSRVTAKNGR
jgi:hypothetical protein